MGESKPKIFVSKSGIFELKITHNICSIKASTIILFGVAKILAPNAFKPNNDNVNNNFEKYAINRGNTTLNYLRPLRKCYTFR